MTDKTLNSVYYNEEVEEQPGSSTAQHQSSIAVESHAFFAEPPQSPHPSSAQQPHSSTAHQPLLFPTSDQAESPSDILLHISPYSKNTASAKRCKGRRVRSQILTITSKKKM